MKHVIMIAFSTSMLISNESIYAMLCTRIPKICTIRQHECYHSVTNIDSKQTRKVNISLHCLNQLTEIDRNTPAFIRYLETKLQDPTIQQQFAGRPSLIIEKHKKNAPQISKFNFHHYLDIYLPSIYQALDLQFERRYYNTENYWETKERIRVAFSSFNDQEILQKEYKTVTNSFKKHFINQDLNWHQKPITVAIADNGDISIITATPNKSSQE